MKWIIDRLTLILLLPLTNTSLAQFELLQVSISHQQDTSRNFSGIDGFKVQRLETHFGMPLVARSSAIGDWFSGAQLTENRFELSGSTTGSLRFYRFALPVEFQSNLSGRWQHELRFTPAYYSDESIIDQTRYINEYSWQTKFQANRKVTWVLGWQKDTQFGSEQAYPVLGLESRPNSRTYHHWVFPDVYSELELAKGSLIRAFAKPDGGNWRYLQDDGSKASFGMTDWNVGLAWIKPIRNPLHIKIELGLKTMGEGSVAGTDGDLSDGYFFRIAIESHLAPN